MLPKFAEFIISMVYSICSKIKIICIRETPTTSRDSILNPSIRIVRLKSDPNPDNGIHNPLDNPLSRTFIELCATKLTLFSLNIVWQVYIMFIECR
ncbi:hypothetical protein RIR_jg27922.t1 [Rhizophagus irregularis DAOM 181602=DAOM 197198]|nr:hypothetical protein RIR_jg27922.t1 [Rhizophagus irregularis DAOM 181602=DAOM 197198]